MVIDFATGAIYKPTKTEIVKVPETKEVAKTTQTAPTDK